MNTYLKILFLGASLSLGFSACQNDGTDNQSEEKTLVETPAQSKAPADLPDATLAEKEEGNLTDAIEEQAIAVEPKINKDSIEAEEARIKKEKYDAARELRHKKRREKRKAERERKRAEKAAALAAAKSEREPIQNVSNANEVKIDEEPVNYNNGNARISFTKTNHNYGTIQQGEEVKYKFKFRNTGTTELVISNVTVSCGCTHPSYPFIPLAPGEEGYIGVHFDSKGRLGKQKPTITVYTNAKPQTYDLYLEGYVDARRESDNATKDSL